MIFMKAKILSLFVLSASLLSVGAQAQEVCRNLESCRALRARVDARIVELEGALPTRIAHGANGLETTFTRDSSIAALNEAWRDPSGMIWGDIVTNDDHSIRYMDQYQATTYCESIGATLPSREDFARLRGYMGATTAASEYSGSGYTPQVLPNLYRTVDGRSVSNYFWSSSVHPGGSDFGYVFFGRTGYVDDYDRDYADSSAVRCVARR
mgnify:CR=1 FL=1